MKKILFSLAFTLICISVITVSCRKNERDEDTETQSTEDNATAEYIFNDVFKQVYRASEDDSLLKLVAASCDTSYLTPAWPDPTFPKTQIIKFDTIYGCTGSDGIHRKGKIKVVYTGMISDSLSKATITFINYYVNGNKLTGTKVITNKGHNSSGQLILTLKVTGASITTSAGKNISWESNRTRVWISGESTTTHDDDIYSVTGTASGTGTKGNSYKVTINSALRVEVGCKHITSGIMTVDPANILPRTVDFGTGGCDNQATVTIAGKTYDVTLP